MKIVLAMDTEKLKSLAYKWATRHFEELEKDSIAKGNPPAKPDQIGVGVTLLTIGFANGFAAALEFVNNMLQVNAPAPTTLPTRTVQRYTRRLDRRTRH